MTTTFALFIVLLAYCNAKAYGNRDETIRKNFHGLFDSVAANNSTSVDFFKKSLTSELDQESQKFGALKEENHARRVTTVHFANDSLAIERRDIENDGEYDRLWQIEERGLDVEIKKVPEVERTTSFYREKVIHCRVEKKQEMVQLLKKQGAIETEKDNIEFTLKVPLTARTRIEVLIRDNFPKNMRKPDSIRECIVIILKSGAPSIRYLYDEVLRLYGAENVEKSIETFAGALENIFGATSGIAAHNIMDSRLMKLFRSGPEELIEKFLDLCKVPHDEDYIKALRAMSLKRPTAKDDHMYEGTLHTYSCVEIKPSTKKMSTVAIFDKAIGDTDVQAFFPTTGSKIKKMQYNRSKDESILSIVVEFESTNVAVAAFDENHGWLKQRRAATRIISCPTSESER